MKNVLPLLLLLFVLIAASSDKKATPKKQLIGIWLIEENETSQNNASFQRTKKFKKDEPGIQFRKNGTLIKRQNSGWCGTPPISYTNYEGTWDMTGDSTLSVQYEFFDGTIEEDWKIIKVDKKGLKIVVLNTRTRPKKVIPKLNN